MSTSTSALGELGTMQANVQNPPPVVSVLVITYQHAPFIAQCLDSILMQRTDFPVEILLGEDESTDGTREICQRYAAKHPDRIRLFLRSRKDVIYILGKPIGRANFLGLLREAKGEYIAICEGDDFWTDPHKLQKQVDLLRTDPQCMGSYHQTKVVYHDKEIEERMMRDQLPDRMTAEQTIEPLSPFHFSSFIFRADNCIDIILSIPHTKVASFDMAMFTIVADRGDLRKVNGVMSCYRKHAGGLTNTSAHIGTQIHQSRILLWLIVDRFLNYRYTHKCQEVIGEHWNHIIKQTTPRKRLRYFLEQLWTVPGWFLRRPRLSFQRCKEITRRN